jgi:monoamine oxidase
MGPVVKLLLRFREPFWNDAAFLQAPDSPFPTWWTGPTAKDRVLTGWAGGPAADRLDGFDRQAIVERSITALARAFGREYRNLADLLEAHYLADWRSEPFARGAYSYVAVGGIGQVRRLQEPVLETLFFAGEHTHALLGGTVAGAVESGYRAAAQVLAAHG